MHEDDEGAILDRPSHLAAEFDRVANDYQARPGYPSEVFDRLVAECDLRRGTSVLEIGPGVGQATLPILDLGGRVTAVEPGPALAARLTERTVGRDITIIVSSFEQADLERASFDLVVSATAFHWVDISVGAAKCAHVLCDGGWLALWWTIWGDPDRPDPFQDALQPVLRSKAPHLLNEDAGPRAYERDLAARIREIERTGAFGPVHREVIRWMGRHDSDTIRRIFGTFAQWIAQPEPLRTELLNDVQCLAREDFGGVVERPYQTVLYYMQRLARGSATGQGVGK